MEEMDLPFIQHQGFPPATDEFPAWGLARFQAGMKNVTELHYHDCDEFIFMVEGQCVIRSEGQTYVLMPGDLFVTRAGDEHELLEIIEDTLYFWAETELLGQKRTGHLHKLQLG